MDRWLAAGNTRSFNIRYFLGWAADRGLAPRLTVPAVPRQDPAHVLDEDERWNQLQRCLTDDTLPLDVRAAGALLLLFGLPAARIRQLRPDDLPERDGSAYLNVGRHPLLLPPRLADLLHQLAAAPVNRTRLTASTQWLFPGRVPGQPAGPSGFSRKLLDHGIDARPARNAALLALIEDLPAPIMADILGLHIHTAERWADIAKRDWTSYLAARVADQGRIEG
jgi:integrase